MDYQLRVDRYDLVEGLKYFKIRRRIKATEKAVLAFDGRYFSIEAFERTVTAKAEGV